MILFYYVEDDPDDAFLLAEALEGLGVELEVFQTPFELLKDWKKRRFCRR
jgi:CheY-like chemotaxis protein